MDYIVTNAPIYWTTRRTNSSDTTARRRKEGVDPVSTAAVAHMMTDPPAYVGVDLHRDSIQFAVVDREGDVVSNKKVGNDRYSIKTACVEIPDGAWYVVESSSV